MGIVQGATEFLPVSSSGHLALLKRITGMSPSVAFDLGLHLATLAAVAIAFRSDLAAMFRAPLSKRNLLLALATLVTAAVAFPLKSAAESAMDGSWLAVAFAASALALTAAGLYRPKTRRPINAAGAAAIGLAQGLAVFPGLSRSGCTFAAGALWGAEHEENSRFCFLLSIPAILGSAAGEALGGGFTGIDPLPMLAGAAAAFVTGLACLKLIEKVFSGGRLLPFAFYLALLSVFITANDLFFHLF